MKMSLWRIQSGSSMYLEIETSDDDEEFVLSVSDEDLDDYVSSSDEDGRAEANKSTQYQAEDIVCALRKNSGCLGNCAISNCGR